MIYQLERIVGDVRVCMDENRADAALLDIGDTATLTLDEVIRQKVTEGVDRVHLVAPYRNLEQGHTFGEGGVYWLEMESGFVLLPGDWLRLVVFAMSDWERAVYEVIGTDSAEYKRQRSRVKALRGTAQRPVCAVGVRPEGLALEFYSCKSEEAEIARAVYMPRARVDEAGGVDVSEGCYRAVVYTVAGLTLESIGEPERASYYYNNAEKELT